MAQIIKEITVDVAKRNLFQAIVAKQHDSNSRFLKVTLTNEGTTISVDTNSVVTINAGRADGLASAFAGVVNADGTVTVPLTTWMLELDDLVKCDITVVDSESRKLTSTSFELEVETAAYDDSEIMEDENYDLLVSLLGNVDLTVTAVYSKAVRTYTVRWWYDAAQTTLVASASGVEAYASVDYPGEVLTSDTGAIWMGWDALTTSVESDMDVHAVFVSPVMPDTVASGYDSVKTGNSVFPSNQHKVQTRRDHFLHARAQLNVLVGQVEVAAEFASIDGETMREWMPGDFRWLVQPIRSTIRTAGAS